MQGECVPLDAKKTAGWGRWYLYRTIETSSTHCAKKEDQVISTVATSSSTRTEELNLFFLFGTVYLLLLALAYWRLSKSAFAAATATAFAPSLATAFAAITVAAVDDVKGARVFLGGGALAMMVAMVIAFFS